MKKCRRAAALLLCVCLLLSTAGFGAFGAFGGPYTTIGDVRFYGGKYLDRIDLTALVRDRETLAEGALFLCRIYDEPALAIETYNYDRIANFELFCDNSVSAVISGRWVEVQ